PMQLRDGAGDLPTRRLATAVAALARGNRDRDPPAHFLRRLDHLSVLAEQVTFPQDAQGGLGPRADLGGTGLRQHGGYLLYLVVRGNVPRSMTRSSRKTVSSARPRRAPPLSTPRPPC